MPKRWRVASGSSYKLQLVDDDTQEVLAETPPQWDSEDDLDDLVEEFRESLIEFSDGAEEPPRRWRKRPRRKA
jgi:hypothetical protein